MSWKERWMESDKCRKSRWYEIRSSKIRRFFLLFLKRPECPFILSFLIVQFAKVRALSNHLMYEKPQVNSASRVFIITSIYIFPVVLCFHCLMCVYFIRYRDRVGWNRFFSNLWTTTTTKRSNRFWLRLYRFQCGYQSLFQSRLSSFCIHPTPPFASAGLLGHHSFACRPLVFYPVHWLISEATSIYLFIFFMIWLYFDF